MRTWFLLSVIAAQGPACATSLSDGASKIRWASSPADVASCEFLGLVEGTSKQTGVVSSTGRKNARNEALNKAAEKGATHVHWLPGDEGWGAIQTTAEAYDCGMRQVLSADDDGDDEKPRRRSMKARSEEAEVDSDDEDDDRSRRRSRTTPSNAHNESTDNDATSRSKKPAPVVSLGSCFFVSPDGIAVTNQHVVAGAKKIIVIDATGAKLPATVLRTSPDVDLVALDIPGVTRHAALPIDARTKLKLGESIFTIGFPYASYLGSDPKFADGSVGGLKGAGNERLLQITIPVQPGNSGGPVVTDAGVVVGVIVAKLNELAVLKDTGTLPENVNFAIKASELPSLLRGVTLSTSKRTATRDDAVSKVRAASCQVVAFMSDEGTDLTSPNRSSEFDCEVEGCPDGYRCEVKSGVCVKQ